MPEKDQLQKFKAAAKEVGADMSEAEFRRTVGKVAKAPKPKKPAKADREQR